MWWSATPTGRAPSTPHEPEAGERGETVTQGQTIGLVGTTGSSTGNHLHFEFRVNGSRQDALDYYPNLDFYS
mgnify:CR=1 FL=1